MAIVKDSLIFFNIIAETLELVPMELLVPRLAQNKSCETPLTQVRSNSLNTVVDVMQSAKKVLVVEDDGFTRFMMRNMVRTLELDVDLASDGEEGCKKIAEHPESYGVVLMDIHMPGIGGIEATRRIRASADNPPRDVPVIAVTTDKRFHNTKTIDDFGMNGFVSKPVSPGQLLGLIQKYCMPPAIG